MYEYIIECVYDHETVTHECWSTQEMDKVGDMIAPILNVISPGWSEMRIKKI
jgi:hypothetical protein